MKTIDKLRSSLSHRLTLGVLLAFLIAQVTTAQHFHSDVVQDESCTVCSLGSHSPALTSTGLPLSDIDFIVTYRAVLPTRHLVSALTFDKLSRAPPLS